MPITENGSIEYTMPSNIKSMLTLDFCVQFLKELHMIFGVGVADTDMDYFVYQGGTGGWVEAFDSACRKLKYDDLCRYYHSLPWYDSDIFDGEMEDVLVEHKLIVGGFLSDEIARQNNMSSNDVACCDKCGRYFNVKDLIKSEIDLGDGEPYIEMVCKSCSDGKDVSELHLDTNRTITGVLNRSISDFFFCEKCGKTHYVAHKGNEFCLQCELETPRDICNANNYYIESIAQNKTYRNSLKCDK